jgi:hypothetical protein
MSVSESIEARVLPLHHSYIPLLSHLDAELVVPRYAATGRHTGCHTPGWGVSDNVEVLSVERNGGNL